MKLYLDENLSPKYRHAFDSERMQLFTYQFMGWQGKKNGELLHLLSIHGFRG
jgi:predicted nuclease of predicted toxin-antitoxin system